MKRIVQIAGSVLFALIIVLAVCIRIQKVDVTGNAWYDAQQVENMVFPDRLSYNSLYCYVKKLLGKKEKIPFIEDYTIEFIEPTHVEVIVYEKSIVGYVRYMNAYMYFDKDGIVVDSSPDRLKGVPEIKGLEFGSIVLYRALPVHDPVIFSYILNLTQMLTLKGIAADTIEYDGLNDAVLRVGRIKVELGGSDNMSGKIQELADMLPKLQGQTGILNLSSYDPTSSSPVYIFKTTEDIGLTEEELAAEEAEERAAEEAEEGAAADNEDNAAAEEGEGMSGEGSPDDLPPEEMQPAADGADEGGDVQGGDAQEAGDLRQEVGNENLSKEAGPANERSEAEVRIESDSPAEDEIRIDNDSPAEDEIRIENDGPGAGEVRIENDGPAEGGIRIENDTPEEGVIRIE